MCHECVQFQREIRKINRCGVTFSKQRRIWSFHVVALQRTAKKCTKNYNARATAIILLIKPFVWWRSRCRCRRVLGKVPNYENKAAE